MKKFNRIFVVLLAFVMILTGGLVLPAQAKEESLSKKGTYDATDEVMYCNYENVNNVQSFGVTFANMGEVPCEMTGAELNFSDQVLISGVQFNEKSAFVLQFRTPIDANKIEFINMAMFAGIGTKVRIYNSQTDNFIEDTAKDVWFSDAWEFEEVILPTKKYADKDGLVRNITFYIAECASPSSLMIDYFKLVEYKQPKKDLVYKAGVETYFSQSNLGENQVPTYSLGDEGVLKDMGWDGAIYLDGTPEHVWKVGRYMSLAFDQVNTAYYETVWIDFFMNLEFDFTIYAYSADELLYTEDTVDQVIEVKGGETTKIKLNLAPFADEYGYVSQINFLLAAHTAEDKDAGFQAFFGDMTFRLPREVANVTIYKEKLSGGFEASEMSTSIEGEPGDKIKIKPYSAEEIGLYGYQFYSGGNNVLSGVLKKGKTLELKLYYVLKNCTVTINNDEETSTKTVKYGQTIDLMDYRKENMLMAIQMDGIDVEDTKVKITEDCTIDIVQTPGNYVFYMVDDELFATRTYVADALDGFVEPIVPVRQGFAGVWEEYELNGGDKTVNAIYTSTAEMAPPEANMNTGEVTYNVANAMEELVKKNGGNAFFWIIIAAIALAIAVIIVLLVLLVRKGKLPKKPVIIGGAAVAVCCAALVVFLMKDMLFVTPQKGTEVAYEFEELFASGDAHALEQDQTLTIDIDKALDDKNYIQIDVDTDVNLFGTIEYYNLDDKSETNVEDFYIEAVSEEAFHQFLDNFRKNGAGQFEKHLERITLTNVSEQAGTVTVNKVAISDRTIDLSQAELYVENEYLKVGMDLICGGALTFLEAYPQGEDTLDEVIDGDGNVRLGINYRDLEGAQLLDDSVNLINIFDKGREVQQSFYADVDENNGYKRGTYVAQDNQDWPYNPVQGGDQDDNSSQIIDYRVEDNLLYVKVRAMDWGQHNSTTKSYMENWYTLNGDMLYVKNRYVDWNGFEGVPRAPINSEMPAVYFAHAFNTFVTYDGTAPWTNGELDRQSELGAWAKGSYVTENPTEGWFAWVNQDDYGIGMYVPGIKRYASGRQNESISADYPINKDAYDSSMLTDYREELSSEYAQAHVRNTDYTAPVITTTMDWYVPLEYTYVIRVGELNDLRTGFKNLDLAGTVDNSGLTVWDDEE